MMLYRFAYYYYYYPLLSLFFLFPFRWTARTDNDVAAANTANNANTIIWTLQATLNASYGSVVEDRFGFDVAVDGSLIVVGAPGKDDFTGAV